MHKTAIFLAFTLAAAPAARAQTAEATIDRAVAAYANISSARATFEQTINNPLTGTTVKATGELYLRKSPNRFAVRFTNPDGDRIVSDGKSMWVYLPSTNPGQAMKMPIGAATGPDVVNDLLQKTRSRYTVSDAGTATVGDRPAHAVLLVPKEARQFTKATVWVDDADASVRQFELVEPSGLVRRVQLTSLTKNATIPKSVFAFTPPKGVRVFDGTKAGTQ